MNFKQTISRYREKREQKIEDMELDLGYDNIDSLTLQEITELTQEQLLKWKTNGFPSEEQQERELKRILKNKMIEKSSKDTSR